MIMNHTDFGMLTFKDDDLLARLQNETGTAAFAPSHFHAVGNVDENANIGREFTQLVKIQHCGDTPTQRY